MEWSNFPTKDLVFRYLDYESKCNLRACSKDDKHLIDSYHFVASKIVITEIPSEMDPEKTIIRLEIDNFTLWFIGKNEKTRIERTWNGEKMEMAETKMENRFDLFYRFIDRFLRNGVFETYEFQVVMPIIEPRDHWRIKCTKLHLLFPGNSVQWVINWLSKVESKMEELMIRNHDLRGLSEMSQVFNVSHCLRLYEMCNLTDEQVEKLEATDLRIRSVFMTEVGIRKVLEHHLRNGQPGDELMLCGTFPDDFDPINFFPKDLIISQKESQLPQESTFYILGGYLNKYGNHVIRECHYAFPTFVVYEKPAKIKRKHLLYM